MEVQKEYERIKGLFNGCDEQQLKLLDGAFWECARIRFELDELFKLSSKTGTIMVHPQNPFKQKELPVAKQIVKSRANYLNYISKLSNALGKTVDDEDNDLNDYE